MSWRFLRALSCPARIIAAVSPLIPLVAGIVALVAGVLVLRTYGPRYRVGRLLASTPEVSVAEARTLAGGPPRYVRVTRPDRRRGRLRGRRPPPARLPPDASPAPPRRPAGSPSRTAGSASDFEVRDGLEGIVVDDAALDAGLVVVPRESVGTAADVADRVPPGTPPDDAGPAAGSSRSRRSSTRSCSASRAWTTTGDAAAVGRARPAARPDHARAGRGDAHPRPRASGAGR